MYSNVAWIVNPSIHIRAIQGASFIWCIGLLVQLTRLVVCLVDDALIDVECSCLLMPRNWHTALHCTLFCNQHILCLSSYRRVTNFSVSFHEVLSLHYKETVLFAFCLCMFKILSSSVPSPC